MAAASAVSLLDIDRKLFYIQSKLLDVNDSTSVDVILCEAKLWFQPRHYIEVIEERSNDSRCGYPSCRNPIIRPSEVSSILKISYKEKRIYEIGRSKLFCCWDCLQKSAIFEAGLGDTHPASRQVAIDFLLQKNDASSAPHETVSKDYFDGDFIAEDISDSWKRSSIQFYPSSSCSSSEPDSRIVRKASPSRYVSKADQLLRTKELNTETTVVANSFPILSFYTETTEVSSTESVGSKPDSKKKKVGFVDLKLLESSVGEKWASDDTTRTSAVKGSTGNKFSASKKSSPRSLDYTSINAIQSAKGSLPMGPIAEKASIPPGQIILSNEEPSSHTIQNHIEAQINAGSVTDSEDTDDDGSDNSVREGEDDLSLFMLTWTSLDDLFGESHSIICAAAADNSAHLSCDQTATPTDTVRTTVGSSTRQEVIEERFSINPTLLASHRAVAMFVERGFNTAETYCDFSVFLSASSRARYYEVKAEILAAIGSNNIVCPRLKSSEFTFLALLVIDAIVVRQCLLMRVLPDLNAVSEEWSNKLKISVEKILRTRAGRHVESNSTRNLRDGDLELLRNFFVRKLN